MVSQNWADRADPAVNDMIPLARAALAQAPNDPEVLRAAGLVIHYAGGDRSGGIALLNRAIELNPNIALTLQMAALLNAYTGDTQLVLTLLERAARLNPLNLTHDFYLAYAISHFVAGQFEATVEWTTKAFEYLPNDAATLRYRAAGLGLLGRVEEGRHVVQRLLALVPGFSITQARRHVEFGMNNPFRPGVADALYEGLRRCGVPE
jgi:tetratricopeptide (TPR) repeat protein